MQQRNSLFKIDGSPSPGYLVDKVPLAEEHPREALAHHVQTFWSPQRCQGHYRPTHKLQVILRPNMLKQIIVGVILVIQRGQHLCIAAVSTFGTIAVTFVVTAA